MNRHLLVILVAGAAIVTIATPAATSGVFSCGSLVKAKKCNKVAPCRWNKTTKTCAAAVDGGVRCGSLPKKHCKKAWGTCKWTRSEGCLPLAVDGGDVVCASLKKKKLCKKEDACSWNKPTKTCVGNEPSGPPSLPPIASPTLVPSASPSLAPSASPTATPSASPTLVPSASPSLAPSASPTATPSASPSLQPSRRACDGDDPCACNWIVGSVTGIGEGRPVVVTVGSAADDTYLASWVLESDGTFEIGNLVGSDDAPVAYWVKYEGSGYATASATNTEMLCEDAVWNVDWALEDAASARRRRRLDDAADDGVTYRFSWNMDASRAGRYEVESANVVTPPEIEFSGQVLEVVENHVADQLLHKYGIALVARTCRDTDGAMCAYYDENPEACPSHGGSTKEGQECWGNCQTQSGPCAWCGAGAKCCRKGWFGGELGCAADEGGANRHECTASVSGSNAVDPGKCCACGGGAWTTTDGVGDAAVAMDSPDAEDDHGSVTWSAEYAQRLLDTLRTMPGSTIGESGTHGSYAGYDAAPLRSVWTLVNGEVANDITWTAPDASGHRAVKISARAFVHASPQMVVMDGIVGKYFSKRLYHAVVRFVSNNGKNYNALEAIFTSRFNCATVVDSAAIDNVVVTGDTSAHFQAWSQHPEEALALLSMFEELPSGFHAVPGLAYVLRRLQGTIHPWYPTAPAVAWPMGADTPSYIEFMDSAFGSDILHTRRLVLHEKAHFMWRNVFDDALREDWTALGGWYWVSSADDCAVADGERDVETETGGSNSGEGCWRTTEQLSFVTAYAHAKNPNEHMAESISYYVENPAALQACCAEQYAFIRDRVMHGYRYVSTLPEELTFEVFNISPDYDYPGKIIRVDIDVTGAADEDKKVTIELELHTANNIFAGASSASARVWSPAGTYVDVWFSPTEGSVGSILRGSFSLSKHAAKGHWVPNQIQIADDVGNWRMSGMDDFGWSLYIDNPLEDLVAPYYVPGTLALSAHGDTDQATGNPVQIVTASWYFVDDQGPIGHGPTYATLVCDGCSAETLQAHGTAEPATDGGCDSFTGTEDMAADAGCYLATVTYTLTEFRPSGTYTVRRVQMEDVGLNKRSTQFTTADTDEDPVYIELAFANTDTQAPELDLDSITVSAEPTMPDAPNGETAVTIVYRARDDKSGLGNVRYSLRDPQGGSHGDYHYHNNFYTLFFNGDATVYAEYTITVLLPVGSAPGTWGLESLSLSDKVGNTAANAFAEITHFEAENDGDDTRRRRYLRGQQQPKKHRRRFDFDFEVVSSSSPS